MSTFLRLTALLFAGLALSVALLIGYERSLAPTEPYKMYGLEACSGHFCLYGIEPGITRYGDAMQILNATGLLDSKSWVRVDMFAQHGNNPIQGLTLETYNLDKPRVGAVIAAYGWPCMASIETQPDNNFTLWLVYPHLSVTVLLSLEPQFIRGGILDSNSWIESLSIYAYDGADVCKPCAPEPNTDSNINLPWLGFGSIQKYLDYYNANLDHLATCGQS